MRKLLITLLVLLVVLVGLDFGGRALAESKLGETIATESGITPAPDVDIHGFSFLWQVVAGEYQEVSFEFPDLTVGPLTGVHALLVVRDTSLPLSEALGGNIDNLTSRQATLRAVIDPTSLASALDGTDITLERGDGDTVLIGTTVAVAGQPLTVQAQVTPAVRDGALVFGDATLRAGDVAIPRELTDGFLQSLTTEIPLEGLPFDLQRATVEFTDEGLVVNGSADDIPVGRLIRAAG